MKKKRFSVEQIVAVLKQIERGLSVADARKVAQAIGSIGDRKAFTTLESMKAMHLDRWSEVDRKIWTVFSRPDKWSSAV